MLSFRLFQERRVSSRPPFLIISKRGWLAKRGNATKRANEHVQERREEERRGGSQSERQRTEAKRRGEEKGGEGAREETRVCRGGAHGCKCVLCSQNGGSSVPRVTQDGLGEEPGTQRNLQSTEGNEAAHYAAEQTPI